MAFNNYLEDENDKPYFTANSLAYYYDKMEGFAKAVEGSAKALNLTKEEVEKRLTLYIEQNKNELDQRLAQWDGKLETFDSSVETLLTEWVDDGTLTPLIDSTLIDQKIAPLAIQLEETDGRINNVIATAGDGSIPTELTDIRVVNGKTYSTAGSAVRALANGEAFKTGSIRPESNAFFVKNKNEFNKNDILTGIIINATGDEEEGLNYVTSKNKVYLKPNTQYSRTLGFTFILAQFDTQNNLIKRNAFASTVGNFTTEPNLSYAKVSIHKDFFETTMINEGATLLPLDTYGSVLKSSNNYPIAIDSSLFPVSEGGAVPSDQLAITPQNSVAWFSSETIPNFYRATSVPGSDDAGGLSRVSATFTSQMYMNKWRELAAAHPEYITEHYLGKDCTGTRDMYRFSLRNNPHDLRRPSDMAAQFKQLPEVILLGGIHGEEKGATFSIYWLVKDMIEKWQTDEALEYLRFSVNFEIFPLVNPSGFDAGFSGTRQNANGVDINRNFAEGHTVVDPSNATYGGETPFSEVETQYVRDLIEAHPNATHFFDYHMNGSSGNDWNNMFWMGFPRAGTQYIPNLTRASKTTLEKCSREWIYKRGFESDLPVIGYITTEVYGGTSIRYAAAQNIPALSLESAKKLPTETATHSGTIITASKEYLGNCFLNFLKTFRENPLK